jgi:ribonuclease Z
MTPLLHPTLVNGRFGDPALFLDVRFEKRAFLFDLGDLHALDTRKLLRVSDIFVSHAHVDHFIGFDQALRVFLGRERTLRVYGPAGIIERVGHKLAGYTWNLVERFDTDLAFHVTEILSPSETRSAMFRLKTRFVEESAEPLRLADGAMTTDSRFLVRTALLDHQVPCLAFSVAERAHINIWKNRLTALDLPVGPWLRTLKQAVIENRPEDTPITIAAGRSMPLGVLKREIVRVTPGQKIAYVVDAVFSEANAERITDLVRDADILFIEATFAREDTARAADRYHLTTGQAGEIARRACVRRVEPFHFSPRYGGEEERMLREVADAFGAALS